MAHVFFHEATHLFTNAEDADKAFRDCLSEFLGKTSSILFAADESLEELAEMLAKNPESVAILNNMIENLTQLSSLVKKKTDTQGQGNTTEEVAEEEGQTTPPEDGKTDSSNPEDGKKGGTEVTME